MLKRERNQTLAILLMLILAAIGLMLLPGGLIGQPPAAGPDRLDFVATAGQTAFPTSNVFPKPNVQVYRNGLLQRQGPAPFDYTQQYIQNGARIRVTFNPQPIGPVPADGDYITLFYYR
jgi:hypothetical protein